MPEHHGDAALDECAAQFFGDLGVDAGEHLLFQLDDCHLGAERAVEVAELEADGAGADDDDARRHLVEHERFLAGDDAVADLHSREQAFARAGGDQNALAVERGRGRRRFAFERRERDGMRAGDGRVGFEVVDFVFLEEIEHALGELVGGGARTRDDFGEVEADFAGLDAVFFRRAADGVHRGGGVEQRLRRDASPVEANAAGAVALDDGDAHFELSGANRGDISARSGADYDEVIAGVWQDEVPSEG